MSSDPQRETAIVVPAPLVGETLGSVLVSVGKAQMVPRVFFDEEEKQIGDLNEHDRGQIVDDTDPAEGTVVNDPKIDIIVKNPVPPQSAAPQPEAATFVVPTPLVGEPLASVLVSVGDAGMTPTVFFDDEEKEIGELSEHDGGQIVDDTDPAEGTVVNDPKIDIIVKDPSAPH